VTTLANYEFQVADLLHDPTNSKWTLPQLDAYINEARRQLVMDTCCLRSLQQSYCTAGLEQYVVGQVTGGVVIAGGSGYVNPVVTFSGGGGSGVAATLGQSGGAVNTIVFSSYGSGYSSAPTGTVTDTGGGTGAILAFGALNISTFDWLDVSIFIGNQRCTLDWYAFRRFSALYRPYQVGSWVQRPAAWAAYGDASIFLGPVPDQSYACEFDTIILPTDYAVGDYVTVDPIPIVTQDPIKFYAARLAKKNVQSFGEAEGFMNDYRQKLLEVSAVYTGRIRSAYSD
jgi:hypothetical protein